MCGVETEREIFRAIEGHWREEPKSGQPQTQFWMLSLLSKSPVDQHDLFSFVKESVPEERGAA